MTNNKLKQPAKAFTLIANGRINEIPTDIGISEPLLDKTIKRSDPRIKKIRAIWDTGATGSVITKETSESINLKPFALTNVRHYGGSTENVNVYLVNIYLPNYVLIRDVKVSECENTNGRFDALIGMDIITLGDFSITNRNGKSVVSYQFPSLNYIDYVKKSIVSSPTDAYFKVGRNDPCPCGSGKKFKHCCIDKFR